MKARSAPTELNLDSLMDTVTNVVGILVLVLVLVTLNIQRNVERIRKEDPDQFGVTEEKLSELQQQFQEDREETQDLQVRVFGLDVRLEQDQQEIQEQQRQLEQLRRDMPELKPQVDLKELQKLVDQRQQREKELQEQLAKIDQEITDVQADLGETPEMTAPPPKIVRLPNPRAAPQGAKPIMFLCREGRVMLFDPEQLQERVKKRVEFLMRPMVAKAGASGEIDCQKLVDTYNKEALSDQEFRSRLVVENFNLVLVYEYRGGGEPVDRLRNPSSRFQAAIRRMDPQKFYARFLVWPDSFDVYVEARTLCDERGVLAGWEPNTEDYQWKASLGIKVNCLGKPKPPPVKPAPPKPDAGPPTPPPPPLPSDVVD